MGGGGLSAGFYLNGPDEGAAALLNRTSRSLSLMETGRQFHQHCVVLVAESKATKDFVDQTRAKPQGTLRMSCPWPY